MFVKTFPLSPYFSLISFSLYCISTFDGMLSIITKSSTSNLADCEENFPKLREVLFAYTGLVITYVSID